MLCTDLAKVHGVRSVVTSVARSSAQSSISTPPDASANIFYSVPRCLARCQELTLKRLELRGEVRAGADAPW